MKISQEIISRARDHFEIVQEPTITQLAKYLDVTRRTVQRWHRAGRAVQESSP